MAISAICLNVGILAQGINLRQQTIESTSSFDDIKKFLRNIKLTDTEIKTFHILDYTVAYNVILLTKRRFWKSKKPFIMAD